MKRAPDSNPKTRWVASDTSSSPHVVTATKINPRRYVCDKQCIGWKSYNICAHCVSAAEDNKELDSFLAWFASSKQKECNLTKAVYHNTYKHAGLKKPPRRKYGDATHLPTDQKTDRLPLCNISNVKSSAVYNDHPYAKCQPQPSIANVCTQITDTSQLLKCTFPTASQVNGMIHEIANDDVGTSKAVFGQCTQPNNQGKVHDKDDHQLQGAKSVGAMKTVQFCSTAQNVGTVNISTSSDSHDLQQITPSVSTTLTMPLVSLLSSIVPHISLPSLLHSITQGAVSSGISRVMPPKPATMKSDQPFVLTMLTNRIKKCSGCGLLFRVNENSGAEVPDYILGHMERDWFPSNGQWQVGKLHNKYYHLQRSCILHRCTLYQFPQDLSTLISTLTTVPMPLKDMFYREFGLKL